MDQRPPIAFVSHASEDKARFVLDFSRRLRERGVDAWLDRWEMLPGDSLVDKIFEEGIGRASAFIIVLSRASVSKPWVREELNSAFVKRITASCRLIPVVIEECEVPACLQSTLWERITDLQHYDDELQRIVNAICGLSAKPPIGTAPTATRLETLLQAPELSRTDQLVFEALCGSTIESGSPEVDTMHCLDPLLEAGLTIDEVDESLQVLDEMGWIERTLVMGGGFRNTGVLSVTVNSYAFDGFARARWPEYESVQRRITSALVNEGVDSQAKLASLSPSHRLVDHILRDFESMGLLKLAHSSGGCHIWGLSPKLARALREAP